MSAPPPVGRSTTAAAEVGWTTREPPLAPEAVAATGDAARALVERLLARSDEELGALSGVSTPDAVVILGPAARLPWADGARYLGRDPRAPSLLTPTASAPTVPIELLERALVARFGPGPLAVLPSCRLALSTAIARPLLRARLQRWLTRAGPPDGAARPERTPAALPDPNPERPGPPPAGGAAP